MPVITSYGTPHVSEGVLDRRRVPCVHVLKDHHVVFAQRFCRNGGGPQHRHQTEQHEQRQRCTQNFFMTNLSFWSEPSRRTFGTPTLSSLSALHYLSLLTQFWRIYNQICSRSFLRVSAANLTSKEFFTLKKLRVTLGFLFASSSMDNGS